MGELLCLSEIKKIPDLLPNLGRPMKNDSEVKFILHLII